MGNIFHRLRDALAPGVPLKVINDGEVTALAAYSKLGGKGNILGISMGSSEGGGYANKDGDLLGQKARTLESRTCTSASGVLQSLQRQEASKHQKISCGRTQTCVQSSMTITHSV